MGNINGDIGGNIGVILILISTTDMRGKEGNSGKYRVCDICTLATSRVISVQVNLGHTGQCKR